jgi:phospho-N-acetylmuramoyl-pentapeptide-transferase
MSKSGTPTMGGLSFLISIAFTLLLCTLYQYLIGKRQNSLSLLLCIAYALLNSAVGIIDDATKLKRKENAGLTPRAKLIFQFVISALFLIARRTLLDEGAISLLPLGIFGTDAIYYIFSLIILVGITNCANLTDGVDGLATSVAFAIGISLFYFAYPISSSASFMSISLTAGAIGFLIFNLHPARVFMGDTGSLFLGALVGALAFELKNPLIAVISGGVYVIEGVSVILQVAYFKMTKKRLFKMSPLHHHLEKCGWDENKICVVAIVATMIFSLVIRICL